MSILRFPGKQHCRVTFCSLAGCTLISLNRPIKSHSFFKKPGFFASDMYRTGKSTLFFSAIPTSQLSPLATIPMSTALQLSILEDNCPDPASDHLGYFPCEEAWVEDREDRLGVYRGRLARSEASSEARSEARSEDTLFSSYLEAVTGKSTRSVDASRVQWIVAIGIGAWACRISRWSRNKSRSII